MATWTTTEQSVTWTAVDDPSVTWTVNVNPTVTGGTTVHNSLTGRSTAGAHPATAVTVDASGFNGNLTTSDDTVQKVAQKVDDLATGGGGPDLSDAAPQDLGTAAAGVSTEASRADHVHDMPTAADVGADPAGTASGLVDDLSGVSNQSTARTNLGLGGAATLNVGTTAGTVAAGDDSRFRRPSWRTSLPSVPNVTYTGADTGGTSNLAYGFLFELTEPTVFSAAHHVFSNAGSSLVARPALLRVTNLATLSWTLEIDFGAMSVSSPGTKSASVTPTTVQPGVFFAASVISQSSAGQWSGVRGISTVATMAGTNVANTWRSLWLFTSSAYSSAPASGWPSSGTLAGNDFANTPPLLHTLFTWSLP